MEQKKDKEKIREEVERLQELTMDKNKNFYSEAAEGEYNALCNIEHFINSLQEEPVSEELEKASKEWLKPQLDKSYADYGEVKMMELTSFDGYAMLDAIEFGAKWQQEKEYTCYEEAFEDWAKWKNENLWKPADGDDLPEIDREVIAILDNGKVVFAHRPPEYWDGRDIVTGKVTRNYPKTYGKGGWNIPNVKYWLDAKLPYEEK